MPFMTAFRRGDVVLVGFPFTNLAATKMRPAVVVSSEVFNSKGLDVILIAITSQIPRKIPAADHMLTTGDQRQAGLPKLSLDFGFRAEDINPLAGAGVFGDVAPQRHGLAPHPRRVGVAALVSFQGHMQHGKAHGQGQKHAQEYPETAGGRRGRGDGGAQSRCY